MTKLRDMMRPGQAAGLVLALSLLSCDRAVEFNNPVDPAVPLSMPGDLRLAGMTDSSLTLQWKDNISKANADQGRAFQVVVEQSVDSKTFSAIASLIDTGTTGTIIGTFQVNRPYYFRIHTSVGEKSSTSSNAVSATFDLSPPSNLTVAFQSESRRQFTWQNHANIQSGFRLEKCIAVNGIPGKYQPIGQTSSNVTSFTDTTTVNIDVSYIYRIAATTGRGLVSAYDSLVINVPFPPPSTLNCSGSVPTTTVLSWTNNCYYPTETIIERSASGSDFAAIGVSGTGVTTFADNSTNRTTTYYYRLKSCTLRDTAGYSGILHAVYETAGIGQIGALPTGFVNQSIVVSRDGSTALVWARIEGVVQLWSLGSNSMVRSFPIQPGTSAVAISGNGQVLGVAVKDSGTFSFSSAGDGHLMAVISEPPPAVDLQISNDGSAAITSGAEDVIRIWNLPGGSPKGSLTGHSGFPISLWLTDDGQTLVSGADQTLRTWDWQGQSQLSTTPGGYFDKPIFRLPDGHFYSILPAYPGIVIQDLSLGSVWATIDIMPSQAKLGYVTPDGYTLVIPGGRGTTAAFNLLADTPDFNLPYPSTIVVPRTGSNSDFLGAGTSDASVKIFRIQYGWTLW